MLNAVGHKADISIELICGKLTVKFWPHEADARLRLAEAGAEIPEQSL